MLRTIHPAIRSALRRFRKWIREAEYDFLLQLASPVGQLHYYCKAKNKAKVGEADLSHAFVQGQLKKLPVLFLSPGVLTKPAQDLLKELKGLTVKQV